MAQTEVTGATESEVEELREEFQGTRIERKYDVPFEVAYCLSRIGKQPEGYDGPDRYCQRRAMKLDDYDGHKFDTDAYAPSCLLHGGSNDAENHIDNLEDPATAAITHGVHAEDEHLRMDFSDAEQSLYDRIVEDWPEIYDWPSEDEDPARYLLLEKAATNVVRTERVEDYLDDEGEVRRLDRFSADGVLVGEEEDHQENPLATEYRLLIRQIQDTLAELGLTPKSRQHMDTMESAESKHDAVTEIASGALDGDHEYTPGEFTDG
jgi:hypothetical protein